EAKGGVEPGGGVWGKGRGGILVACAAPSAGEMGAPAAAAASRNRRLVMSIGGTSRLGVRIGHRCYQIESLTSINGPGHPARRRPGLLRPLSSRPGFPRTPRGSEAVARGERGRQLVGEPG